MLSVAVRKLFACRTIKSRMRFLPQPSLDDADQNAEQDEHGRHDADERFRQNSRNGAKSSKPCHLRSMLPNGCARRCDCRRG